jgi:hypothetical protein
LLTVRSGWITRTCSFPEIDTTLEEILANKSDQKKDVPAPADQSAIPVERGKLNNLILGNANYFGTLPQFGGQVVKKLSGDTTYEELTCLGLNNTGSSGNGLLEAVVNIKQHFGYGTDACGAGTTEFVRFFVHDGSGWHDLGLSSVTVYDLAGPLPLSYSVSVDFKEARKFCQTENIVEVRGYPVVAIGAHGGRPQFHSCVGQCGQRPRPGCTSTLD